MQVTIQPSALPFKSVAIALIFAAVFGPFGLLYSSVAGGIIMIISLIIGLPVFKVFFALLGAPSEAFPLVLLGCWIISIIWAAAATNSYNKKLLAQTKSANDDTRGKNPRKETS